MKISVHCQLTDTQRGLSEDARFAIETKSYSRCGVVITILDCTTITERWAYLYIRDQLERSTVTPEQVPGILERITNRLRHAWDSLVPVQQVNPGSTADYQPFSFSVDEKPAKGSVLPGPSVRLVGNIEARRIVNRSGQLFAPVEYLWKYKPEKYRFDSVWIGIDELRRFFDSVFACLSERLNAKALAQRSQGALPQEGAKSRQEEVSFGDTSAEE
jgi:hypothetical protein